MIPSYAFYCAEEAGPRRPKGDGPNLHLPATMLLRWVNGKNKSTIRFTMILGHKEKKNSLYFTLNF